MSPSCSDSAHVLTPLSALDLTHLIQRCPHLPLNGSVYGFIPFLFLYEYDHFRFWCVEDLIPGINYTYIYISSKYTYRKLRKNIDLRGGINWKKLFVYNTYYFLYNTVRIILLKTVCKLVLWLWFCTRLKIYKCALSTLICSLHNQFFRSMLFLLLLYFISLYFFFIIVIGYTHGSGWDVLILSPKLK